MKFILLFMFALSACSQTPKPKVANCGITTEMLNYEYDVLCKESSGSPRMCLTINPEEDEETHKLYFMVLWFQRSEICEDGWEILSFYKWYPENGRPKMIFDREEIFNRRPRSE